MPATARSRRSTRWCAGWIRRRCRRFMPACATGGCAGRCRPAPIGAVAGWSWTVWPGAGPSCGCIRSRPDTSACCCAATARCCAIASSCRPARPTPCSGWCCATSRCRRSGCGGRCAGWASGWRSMRRPCARACSMRTAPGWRCACGCMSRCWACRWCCAMPAGAGRRRWRWGLRLQGRAAACGRGCWMSRRRRCGGRMRSASRPCMSWSCTRCCPRAGAGCCRWAASAGARSCMTARAGD